MYSAFRINRVQCKVFRHFKKLFTTISHTNDIAVFHKNSLPINYVLAVHKNYCNSSKLIHSFSVNPKDERNTFAALFPEIKEKLTSHSEFSQDVGEVMDYFKQVLEYNVPHGKLNRGITVVSSYKLLETTSNLTDENIHLARILGWCVEMIQAFFLVMDDVMDGSETRRGAPCWYRQPGIGLNAVNDGLFIENATYILLNEYLENHPNFISIVKLFHDTIYRTVLGQCLDTLCTDSNGKPRLNMFTMDRYRSLVKYKTSFYTFQMPVMLALLLANKNNKQHYKEVERILLQTGEFFQIQDDYLDCFGNPAVTGKVGTDIQDGKCSWLVVQSLKEASPEQRMIIEKHYGRHEEESISAIRELYFNLKLPEKYSSYEEDCVGNIKYMIQQLPSSLPQELFLNIINLIYKRKK